VVRLDQIDQGLPGDHGRHMGKKSLALVAPSRSACGLGKGALPGHGLFVITNYELLANLEPRPLLR
jgi:hypothetical protein